MSWQKGHIPWNKGIEWEKRRFILTPSPELSYLIGVNYGDMRHMKYEKKSQFAIGLLVTDKDFVEEFRRCACSITGKKPSRIWETSRVRKGRKKEYGWTIFSKKLFKFFSETLDVHKPFIEGYEQYFLRGLFDSEGTITSCSNKTNTQLRLSFGNKEVTIYSLKLLDKLGMQFKYYEFNSYKKRIGKKGSIPYSNDFIHRKMMYTIATKNKNIIKNFGEKICFTIKRKQDMLIYLINYVFKKYCVICGKEFEPNSNAQKYCNNCRKKNQ